MKRVLICANPDLNYIDGSSIWAQTIALALSESGARVDFIAKSKPTREELFSPLRKKNNLSIIDGTSKKWWNSNKNRLSFAEMVELAVKLDETEQYDVIVVRGLEIAKNLSEHDVLLNRCWLYLTDIPQSKQEFDDELRKLIIKLATNCLRLLCQTEGFKRLWLDLVPGLSEDKISIYTPVIPDITEGLTPIEKRPRKAIYAGKFKSDWMTLEMAELWPEVVDSVLDAELVMIGDKIHIEPEIPTYQEQMQEALQNTPKLTWLGAQSRESVQEELKSARVGLSWRSESMNDTVEYSTKILEYGGAGCSVILNRNALHESLLGSDYPLYANSPEEFKTQLILALQDDDVAKKAAMRTQELAKKHTFSSRVNEIKQWLIQVPKRERRIRILVAGHDLKFFTLLQKKLEETGKFEFLIDQWQGHNKHDEAKSRELLQKADVIFCEWCLGNLQWYSHNKLPQQRLVARFHLQERELPYVAESNWDNIAHIAYVSDYIQREGQKAFGFPFDKTSVIPNLLDESKFTLKKKTGDAHFTLGIIGVVPNRKRLDRALNLLEILLEKDSRYCLRVKGKHPLDYGWLLNRDEELAYYRELFFRINNDPVLRHKVIFDPPGDDINEWFTMVGFILSPSDFESFHMAVGEGMLTGAVPVIWNWDGADEIWPKEYVIESIDEAVKIIDDNSQCGASANCREQVLELYDSSRIVEEWIQRCIADE